MSDASKRSGAGSGGSGPRRGGARPATRSKRTAAGSASGHGASAARAAGGSGARSGGGGSPVLRRAGPPPNDPGPSQRRARRTGEADRAPDRLPVQLFLGLIVGIGTTGLAWLLGAVGHRLGFAMAMRVPELDTGGTRALTTGIMMLVDIPRVIFLAGINQPFWLLAGFLLLAVPAAGLAAAEPRRPGAPPANSVFAAIANLGAVGAILTTVGMLWWTGSGTRTGLMRPMPTDPAAAADWPAEVATAAGLDVLAVVGLALWVVLVFRLPVARWLRALATSIGCFGLVVVTVAMSISGATASQVAAQRSAVIDAGSAATPDALPTNVVPALLLGRSGDREAILLPTADGLEVRLRVPPGGLRIVGRASVAEMVRDAASDD